MIKKLLIKVGIIVGIMLAVPYYFYGGGKMPGFLQDFGWGGGTEKPAVPENFSNAVTDKEVTVYKWVDKDGIQHFGSTAPAGVVAEEKHLRPNDNVIQAMKIPEKEETEKKPAVNADAILKNPYKPENVKQLINDAKNVQKLLDQRFENQKEVMGSGR